MRKIVFGNRFGITIMILFFGLVLDVKAQSFSGFLTDNYSGVNSVIDNPSNIVDSRFKTDINLIGASAFIGNDYYTGDLLEAFREWDTYNLRKKYRFNPQANNSGEANVDVMGISAMFNINAKNAVAIFTRARSFFNVNGINGEGLYNIVEEGADFTVNQDDFNAFGQAWAEIGVSYARVLINDKENFLKGGISLKYLKGGGSAFVVGRNINLNYDADGSLHSEGGTTGSITSTGLIALGRFENFNREDYEYEVPKGANGLGLDFGIVYEWRPNYGQYKARKVWPHRIMYKDENKYKLKLGLSITDIGYINYKNGIKDVFDITNVNVSKEALDNQPSFYDALNNIYTLTNSSLGYRAILPTALHLNVDWHIENNFYLNFNTDVSLTSKDKITTNTISDLVSITPRYESKWFSFYMPFSVIQHVGFQSGAGLRFGPLYLGSNTVVTNLFNKKSKSLNIYAGLKIPIFHGPIE